MPSVQELVRTLPQAAGLYAQFEHVMWKEMAAHRTSAVRALPDGIEADLAQERLGGDARSKALTHRIEELLNRLDAQATRDRGDFFELTPECLDAIKSARQFLSLGGTKLSYPLALNHLSTLAEFEQLEEKRALYGDQPLPQEQAQELLAREVMLLGGLAEMSGRLDGAVRFGEHNFFKLSAPATALCDQVAQFLSRAENDPLVIAERAKLAEQARLSNLGELLSRALVDTMPRMNPAFRFDASAMNHGFDSLDNDLHARLRRSDEIYVRLGWTCSENGERDLVATLRQGKSVWARGKTDLPRIMLPLADELRQSLMAHPTAQELLKGNFACAPREDQVRSEVSICFPISTAAARSELPALPGGKEGLLFVR